MMYLNYSPICSPTVLPTSLQLGVRHREHAGRAADVGRRTSGIGEEAEQHRRSPEMAPSCEYQRRDSDDDSCFLLGIFRLNVFFIAMQLFHSYHLFCDLLRHIITFRERCLLFVNLQSSRCFSLRPNLSNQREINANFIVISSCFRPSYASNTFLSTLDYFGCAAF